VPEGSHLVLGFGFRVQRFGFRVLSSEFEFRVLSSEFGVQSSEF
jgi:hypothetical protein